MIDQDIKNRIDDMSHEQLCHAWRFEKSGDALFQGEAGEYFRSRLFDHFGGFTPEISKRISHE